MINLLNRLREQSGKSFEELRAAWKAAKKLHARQGYNPGGVKHTQLSLKTLKESAKPATPAPAAPSAPKKGGKPAQ
jgi:hypothetical protein